MPKPSESDGKLESSAAKDSQTANSGKWADRYEYRLEVIGSLVLILVGVLLWTKSGGKLGQAVGANLLAAGCVALIVFLAYGWLFRRRSLDQAEERSKLENDHVRQAINGGLARSLLEFHAAQEIGLTDFTIGRPPGLNDAALAASKTLDILEISLKTMQSIDASRWRDCKAKIRIILLDPLYPNEGASLARQRDIEEGAASEEQILGEIHEILEIFPEEWFTSNENDSADKSTLQASDPDQSGEGASARSKANEARVKLARAMPTMSYFRIDGRAYFAPLVHRQLGHETMHLQLSQGGQFFTALETHFDKLWNDRMRVATVQPADIPQHYRSVGSSSEAAS